MGDIADNKQVVLLSAIGTRGDIEPFLTLGRMLEHRGHRVHYNIPEQLCHLATHSSQVHPLSHRFLDLIDGPDARLVMGRASKVVKARAMWRLYRSGLDVNRLLLLEQEQVVEAVNPDLIVFHSKCFYPILWHLSTSKRIVLLTPVPFLVHPVDDYPHVGFTTSMGRVINRWTYSLIRTAIAYSIKRSQSDTKLDVRYGVSRIRQLLVSMPAAFAISPTIVHRPLDWPDNAQVVGYHHRTVPTDWLPPHDLVAFLKRHDRVLFLTFGSMVNDDPEVVSRQLYEVLDSLGIPTIVNCADGGLVEVAAYSARDDVYFIQGIPYTWLLPQVDAIICHGGAGTTHQALLHGLPTMIIPHIMDQYVWAQLVQRLGAGTRGLPLNQIADTTSLISQIRDLWTNDTYKEAAIEACRRMQEEDLEALYVSFVLGY